MRKTQDELQQLMMQYDAKTLWSWSRYNTYHTDPYSYLLKYILKIPEDKNGNAFSFLGGFTHEALEEFYEGNLDNQGMVNLFEDKVFEQQLMDIRFASDDDRNDSIRNKYIDNIKHFLHNYIKDEDAKIESCVHIKIGDHLFYGYVDKIHVEYGTLYVEDFKTSTQYKGEKIHKEKGQLLLYSMAIHEMSGIPLSKIKARWNFCKYVSIDCEQVNGKIANTVSERNAILDTLRAKLKTWCSKFGYSAEQFEEWFEKANVINGEQFIDFQCLEPFPKEVRDKFVIKDCLVEVPVTEEELNKFILQIKETCDIIINKEKEYSVLRDNNLFWIDIDNKNSFFFTNLCGYSAHHHAPLKAYLDTLTFMSGDDMDSTNKSKADSEFLKALLGD